MMELREHPLASIFPNMSAEDFAGLKADIAVRGVLEPVWLYEGMIVDGRHRVRACRELDLPYPTRVYEGADPLGFILALNLHRRHLNESQRAMIAAALANMTVGRPRASNNSLNSGNKFISQEQAAKWLNVGMNIVSEAVKVRREATPELIEAVEQGQLKVHTVYQTLREAEVIMAEARQPEDVSHDAEPDAEPDDEPDADDWELTPSDGEDIEPDERPAYANYQKTLEDILDDLLMVLDGFERHGGIAVVTRQWPKAEVWRYWQQLTEFQAQWSQLCHAFEEVWSTVTIPSQSGGGQTYEQARGPAGIQSARLGDLPGDHRGESSDVQA
jgi:hypothetical protein